MNKRYVLSAACVCALALVLAACSVPIRSISAPPTRAAQTPTPTPMPPLQAKLERVEYTVQVWKLYEEQVLKYDVGSVVIVVRPTEYSSPSHACFIGSAYSGGRFAPEYLRAKIGSGIYVIGQIDTIDTIPPEQSVSIKVYKTPILSTGLDYEEPMASVRQVCPKFSAAGQ